MASIPAKIKVGEYTITTTPGIGSSVQKPGLLVPETLKTFWENEDGTLQECYDKAKKWAEQN